MKHAEGFLFIQMQVATGSYHTLLIHDFSVYSCGSSLCGVLGHGPDTKHCAVFSRINFFPSQRVLHISASHNHAAFVMQSGEVIAFQGTCNTPMLNENDFYNLCSSSPFLLGLHMWE